MRHKPNDIRSYKKIIINKKYIYKKATPPLLYSPPPPFPSGVIHKLGSVQHPLEKGEKEKGKGPPTLIIMSKQGYKRILMNLCSNEGGADRLATVMQTSDEP